MEFLFLLIGLGFFLFVINIVLNSDRESYARKLNEQREFGYQAISGDPPRTDARHKK